MGGWMYIVLICISDQIILRNKNEVYLMKAKDLGGTELEEIKNFINKINCLQLTV